MRSLLFQEGIFANIFSRRWVLKAHSTQAENMLLQVTASIA